MKGKRSFRVVSVSIPMEHGEWNTTKLEEYNVYEPKTFSYMSKREISSFVLKRNNSFSRNDVSVQPERDWLFSDVLTATLAARKYSDTGYLTSSMRSPED